MSEHTHTISRRAFIGGAATAGAVSLAFPSLAFGVTSAEKQAEADEVRSQLVGLQTELEEASDKYYLALDERDVAQAAMDAEQVKIDDATERIGNLQERLSSRARSMYRTGSSTFLDFLLGATSFEEFTQNWDLLSDINEQDSQMVEQTKSVRVELEQAKEEYSRQEQIASEKAEEARVIKEEIQVRIDEANTLVAQLDEEAKELLEEEQAAAAAAEAAKKAQEAAAAAQSSSSSSSSSSSGSVAYVSSGSGGSVSDCSSVVDYALSRIGCPYVWGAEGPDSFDCSGLVTWCYRQMGMYVPHQSESQYAAAKNIVSVSEARPGDVLWRYGHVGIAQVYGGTTYIHAPTFGAYVRNTDSLSWSGFTAALQF